MGARSRKNGKTQQQDVQQVVTEKRGRGRPKKTPGEGLCEKLSISLPADQVNWLRAWALLQEEKVSEVIRQAIVEFRERYSQ